jgi:hypothetical protein
MDIPSQAVIDVLRFLLPGFVTAQLLYSLTPAPRPIPFERIIQALIFTIVIQVGIGGVEVSLIELGSSIVSVGVWSEQTSLVWSLVLAVLMAIVLALSQNSGYMVLHLSGQRRLYGWVDEWPNQPDRGHFVMAEAEWLADDRRVPLTGVRRILIRAQDVEMVELMRLEEAASFAGSEELDGRS